VSLNKRLITRVKASSHQNTAFQQLLKPLSRHEFEGLAKKHHVGQKLRSASAGIILLVRLSFQAAKAYVILNQI